MVLNGEDDVMCKISQALEIKVALLTFQSSPLGVPISKLVADRPQSNNESNDSIKEIELEALATLSQNNHARFFLTLLLMGCHVKVIMCER